LNDWTPYGDTVTPPDDRDLTESRSLSEYPLANVHETGKIFGNMIYRIQQKPGVSAQALGNLVLETYARMSPGRAGDLSTYDIADSTRRWTRSLRAIQPSVKQ
jgi:hypothetical protein